MLNYRKLCNKWHGLENGEDLLKRGIDPNEIGWKSLEQIKEEQQAAKEAEILPEDIARMDKKSGLTSAELVPLEQKGLKKWIEDIKEKLKQFIGKAEK